MKRIIYTFLIGLICAFTAIGQPYDLTLSSAESGTQLHQALNSITLAAGYSYTPTGGTMLAEIVNPNIIGFTSYATAIIPTNYAINTALAVGSTSGDLQVSGVASYNVPLNVPKGSAGLQPSLSLNYTSTYNDGLMGIGWNMGGLSSISRVNQNLYFETQSNPIKGDLTDKYALDGKRIIVTSGTYGADLSVYGTELEEFSKIISKGSSGTGQGPAYFEVRTKSGLICEYGNTTDSKVLRDGTCILTWKINKITDRYGNYITYTYFESDDERPILQIDYTGNSAAGKTPFAQINFRYTQRSDISTYVYGGKEFTRDILLDNIEVKNNGQIFKRYELSYVLDNYAELQKITEYSSQNQPLNPLVFTYFHSIEFFSTRDFSPGTGTFWTFQGDFNGDGRADFITVPAKADFTTSDKWKLYLGSSTGQMIPTQIEGFLDDQFSSFQVADMDGDGLDDLLRKNKRNLSFYKSTGAGFIVNPNICTLDPLDNASYNIDLVDYNGDGILEIFRRAQPIGTTSSWWLEPIKTTYALYNLSGTYIGGGSDDTSGEPPSGEIIPLTGSNHIVDFNGDGRTDMLLLYKEGYRIYTFNDSGTLIHLPDFGYNCMFLNNSNAIHFGDFNGDGTTDILTTNRPDHPDWSMLSLTKDGFKNHSIYGFSNFNLAGNNNRTGFGDVNGDGKMDIIIWGKGQDTNNTTCRINVAINKGNGYEYTLAEYITPSFYLDISTPINSLCEIGDYNGDGCEELYYRDSRSLSKLFEFSSGTPGNRLRYAIDGLGNKSQITYLPMSDINIYTRGTGAVYPLSDFSSGMQLVRQVDSDDGIGGLFTTTYKYEGAKIHLKGKGFLGFAKITQTNMDTGIFTENNIAFESPYYYPKLMTSYTKQGTTPISTVQNTWGTESNFGSNRIFPYIISSVSTDNLKNLSITSSVTYPTTNTYGNSTSITKAYSSGPTETTSLWYNDERVSDWLIGRPTTINKTTTKGVDTQTYTISRTYSATNNSPDIDQNNSGDDSNWQLNRDYDAFGNLAAENKAATGLTETHTTYLYDSNGVNLMKMTDPIGNQTSFTWYPTTGLLNTQTDPFGNIVTYNYNTSDQLSSVVPSTGVLTTIARSFDATGGPINARYYIDKTGNDGSQAKIWYDKLGRELRAETKKLGGTLVKVDKQYNLKGELAQYSESTIGTPSSWNLVGHDNYGRINSLDPIFGTTTTYSEPIGNSIITRTVNGRSYKTTENAAGQVTSTEDPGGTITNGYWPNGLLRSTTTPNGYSNYMTYDKNGNRLSISDPSTLSISNSWYGTGQPKTLTNNGQTTTYTYTPDQKVLLQSYASPEGTTNYTYYTNGLVNTITSPGNVTRSYTYELGKVKTIAEAIDGVSNLITFEYDTKGRLYRKYFNGTSEYEQYDYETNSGYLYRIQFTAAGTTSTVWQLTNMDVYKRITSATIGSTGATWSFDSSLNMLSGISATGVQGYTYLFDANTGNMSSRTNSLRSKTDNFNYDAVNLDRLISAAGLALPTVLVAYTNDKNGNIQSKSDAGTFVYDATQPYAVDQITNGLNISTAPQAISYTSFGKVKNLSESIKTADFVYNADQQRIRMTLNSYGTATKTRWYFGGSCEQELIAGVTTQYIWIGGDAYSAVAVAKKVGTGSWTVYNIFRDHLGTITHLKNGTNPADEYSFDAWGRRRDKDDWTTTLTSEPALFADRGFTGHEYLEDFKLYNMNGRLYDPVVGRFLNADPFVQDPSNTQSYNRYSYCLNNPLKFNDPSGELPVWMLWPISWAGNWAIGGLDRWINGKQPFKQAFSVTKNPVVFSGNYSPSANQFSNYQVVAQKGARSLEKKEKKLDEDITSLIGAVRDQEKLAAMGWGIEANALIFSLNAGWYSTGETGGIVLTFSSGLSNSLSLNVYGATVTSSKNGFKIADMNGRGVEGTFGKGALGYTRASNNFDNPAYYINQFSVGIGYFNKSAGILNTGTFVVPTLPVLIVEPHY